MKFDKRSIAFKLLSLIIAIVLGQAALLSFFLIFGGVIDQAERNAYSSFTEKVRNRRDYLQKEMSYKWINMDPYLDQISDLYHSGKEPEQFFKDISTSLVAALRTTQATGIFLIMDSEKEEKSAVYVRDYDPVLNDYNNRDLYLVYGPSEFAHKLQIPLDQTWKYKLNLSEISSDFYEMPLSKTELSSESKLLGYWSLPFQLSPQDIRIITYTMPLFDSNQKVIGVIGIEISEQYLNKYMPATDLQTKDSYGYMLGYGSQESNEIKAIVLTKAVQHRIIKENEAFGYKLVNSDNSISLLQTNNMKGKIYIAVESLGLYANHTPFEQNRWYLIGLMHENQLLSYVNKIKSILFISLTLSAIAGIVFGYLISRSFTRPIIEVAEKVKNSDKRKEIHLEETGLLELDELSKAVELSSNMLIETSGKMSRIMDMVGFPLGVFEYSEDKDTVFVTDQVARLLELDELKTNKLLNHKSSFVNKMNELLSHPEEEEDDIYCIDEIPEKWLKIRYIQNDRITLGVIMDASEEMKEKKKILNDRDTDPLTGIYNRKAMQQHMEEALAKRDTLGISALLMFDLDNLKGINDTYGHKWGDIYINHAVKHLVEIDIESQVLGRRSGDEFALLIYDQASRDVIREAVEEFFQKLEKDKLTFPDGVIKAANISAGLVWVGQEEYSFEEYLQKADELLYHSKKNVKGYYSECN
ncbi:MAG: diguanylate cyclase precursor [Herbinix sp.]|nr:diguanylate cyclase precursor [Herbinix sp.]